MPRIPTSISIPAKVINKIVDERKYCTKVEDDIYWEAEKAYRDLRDLIEEKIKNSLPLKWGAETNGVGGLEFDCLNAGMLESLRTQGIGGKVTFALGTAVTFGMSLVLLPIMPKDKYLIPLKYHYILTNEHTEIKGLEKISYSQSEEKRINWRIKGM